MKIATAGLAAVLLFAASDASAWPWSKKKERRARPDRLPQAIDSPILRPKIDDSHKRGNKDRHPSRYQDAEWGSESHRINRHVDHPKKVPSLYQE